MGQNLVRHHSAGLFAGWGRWRRYHLDCAFYVRMQRAKVVDISRRSGAECAGSRVGSNLIGHKESRISGHAGPMRYRIVVGPHNVVPWLDFRQGIRIKVRTGRFGYVWIDIDEPLKRHVANSSLQSFQPCLKETSSLRHEELFTAHFRCGVLHKKSLAPAQR